ncbi:protein FAM180A [Denticeps clupeoides]|uniref:protein FAM180A n=1 Tax=Denticeps clupeoides TaxID=299321 RepID=UPI0010A5851C|nr:protein FAM180A [Denticeps clupeoides]
MVSWRLVFILTLLCCRVHMAASRHWTKALYPEAHRVKRGSPALINPTFQESAEDAGLLYEVLLAGLHLDDEGTPLGQVDPELASLRKVQTLEVICEDVLPRRLTDIRRLLARLSLHRGALSRDDFERTVLTMVFVAQSLEHLPRGHQRELWSQTLLELQKVIKRDLTLR